MPAISVPFVTRKLGWKVVVGDGVTLLVMMWTVPFMILAVGVPLALAVALLLKGARLALNAF